MGLINDRSLGPPLFHFVMGISESPELKRYAGGAGSRLDLSKIRITLHGSLVLTLNHRLHSIHAHVLFLDFEC